MGRDDALVTIAIFRTEPEAELARSRLIDAGIDAMIQRDDAGGMYPQFQQERGLRLRVRQEDESDARELLGVGTESGPSDPRDAGSDEPAGA